MAKFKLTNKYFFAIIFVLIIVILGLLLFYFYEKQNTHSYNSYRNIEKKEEIVIKPLNPGISPQQRHDERVLYDQLYPPTNRTETPVYNAMDREIKNRNMYVPTQQRFDDFRMVGYMVSQEGNDSGGNNWKLFAKQRNNNNADFYMVPANNNYDIKIPISNDIVIGNNKLKDVYTIPDSVQFNSPLLNSNPYVFIELPKTDLTDPRYL
jgi:hypothetical protein